MPSITSLANRRASDPYRPGGENRQEFVRLRKMTALTMHLSAHARRLQMVVSTSKNIFRDGKPVTTFT